MPETWIDDHTGDETLARPDFRTDLRAQLAKEWVQPTAARATATGRRTPWKAIGWSVAAAAAVAGTVVVLTRDDTHRIVNTPSTEVTTDTTVPTVTRADLVDVTWAIASVDGVDYSAVQVPRFTLSEDGSLRGSDGCNDIGTPPSGWALDGNTMTIGSQMDSTAVDCGRAGVWPFAPGGTSTLALDASTTHLTIRGTSTYVAVRLDDSTQVAAADVVGAYTSTDGTARLSVGADGTTTFTVGGTTEDVAAPAFHVIDGVLYVDVGEERGLVQFPATPQPTPAVIVVPPTGGPNVTPHVVTTLDGATTDTVHVAMLPDRIVILPLTTDFRFSGIVHSIDRAGNPLPDSPLAVVPADTAGFALGGFDGTLYLETSPQLENTQTTKAYTLDGDTWREVDSYFVRDNNDATYSVSGAGLLLADQVVIPTQTPTDADTNVIYRYTDGTTFDIVRHNAAGTTVSWTIQEGFENLSIPGTPLVFGDGALYDGNPIAQNGDEYLAVLRPNGPNEVLRLDGWQLLQTDGPTAVLTRLRDGKFEIGVLPAEIPIDAATGKLFGHGIGDAWTADQVEAIVSAELGAPTHDSGWFTTVTYPNSDGTEDCMGGRVLRVLHWGDLSIALQKINTADGQQAETLFSWTVGDTAASGIGDRREVGAPADPVATGLTTSDGIGVGSTVADVEALLGTPQTLGGPPESSGQLFGYSNGLQVLVRDGVIVGLGNTLRFC